MKTVYRFCDANDSTTCLSNAAQQCMSLPGDSWQVKGVRDLKVLTRAAEHMDGRTSLSPFVSIATNVLELVKWGVSGGLLDIIYGVDHPERRAPHIVMFQVPYAAIISPDDITAAIPDAAMLSGIMRSRMETELLYYGNDIKRYQKSFSENRYTNESYQALVHNLQQTRMQEQKVEEAEAALQIEQLNAANVGNSGGLSTKLILKDADAFKKTLIAFLATQSARLSAAKIDTTAVATLNREKIPAVEFGLKLRPFDKAILASDDLLLRQAWAAASKDYR